MQSDTSMSDNTLSRSNSSSLDKLDSIMGLESMISIEEISRHLSVPTGFQDLALSSLDLGAVVKTTSSVLFDCLREDPDEEEEECEDEQPSRVSPVFEEFDTPPKLPSFQDLGSWGEDKEEAEKDKSDADEGARPKKLKSILKNRKKRGKMKRPSGLSPQPSVSFDGVKEKPSKPTPAKKKKEGTSMLAELFRRTTRPMFTTRVIILHFIHILIAIYFLAKCQPTETTNPSMPWHDMVCSKTEVGWGTSVQSFPSLDRFLHLDLGIFFIMANVIPKYIKRDLAKRHQHNVVKRLRINPLLVHVIAGIATVLISGLVSWTEWYNNFSMTLVVVADLAHQFSIYRLLKNHDGIWQLRVGNLALGIAKWICTLRILVLGDWVGPTNVIFIHSMGFGLTRLFCFCCAMVYKYVNEDLLVKEHWYSIGLSAAQFYCGYRNQVTYAPVFWISCVMCNMFYYGKNRDRSKQNEGILMAIVMALVCKLLLADSLQIPAIIAYYMTGYWAPILTRTRDLQAPTTPKTPAINWQNGFRKSLQHVIRS